MTVNQLPLPTATDEGLSFEDLLYLDTPEGYRTELIEGKLIVSPPPFIPHAFSVTKLRNHLMKSLPDEIMMVEGPGVYYTEHDYFIPDLVVVHQEAWKRYVKGFIPADVMVVVEVVSPSSSSYDNVLKRHAYAKASIRHYWILDAKPKTVRILMLDGASYVDHRVVELGQVWQTEEPFQVSIEPAKLFLE
jgi:Uma2 family endonuclease